MEKPFSSASTSKMTVAEQEKRWGKLICVLVSGNNRASVGRTPPACVTHFFWSKRKQKAMSILLAQWFFLPHTQLYGKSIPVRSQQQQQGWLLCSLASSCLTAPCWRAVCPSSARCGSGTASPLFCFGDVRGYGREQQVCSNWGLSSPVISHLSTNTVRLPDLMLWKCT